jgi:hypothetical protein
MAEAPDAMPAAAAPDAPKTETAKADVPKTDVPKADVPKKVLPGIAPLDPGLPALAWVMLGRQPFEHEIACAGASSGSWGKARVVAAGTRDFDVGDEGTVTLAHWKVEGDCGAFDLFLGDDGVPVRMQAGDRQYERFVRK